MKPNQPTIHPFLTVNGGARAVDFYTAAFGAAILSRYDQPGGKVVARLAIGHSEFWVGDEEAEYGNLGPNTVGGASVRIILTVDDPDTMFNRAINAGATEICPVTTEEYWRIGKLKDPFGHVWEIGKVLE